MGDVPYKDNYAMKLKTIKDKRLIFTGYVKDETLLSYLYKNCFAYIHGHEFGGTNPTMINALDQNCLILALDSVFNKEMLFKNPNHHLFSKNVNFISEVINKIEKNKFIKNKYMLPNKYKWDLITKKYLNVFYDLNKF